MAYLPSDAETSDASFATTLTCSSAAGGAALEPCAKLMDATPSGDAPALEKKRVNDDHVSCPPLHRFKLTTTRSPARPFSR